MVELTGREMKRTIPTTLRLSRSGAVDLLCRDILAKFLVPDKVPQQISSASRASYALA